MEVFSNFHSSDFQFSESEKQHIHNILEQRLLETLSTVSLYPLVHRAHHRMSLGLWVKYAYKAGHIGSLDHFFSSGVPTSKELIHFGIDMSMRYVDVLKKEGKYISYYLSGFPVPYVTDRVGETVQSTINHIEKDSEAQLRFLISPDRPLFVTAYPDNRCQACAIGIHCEKGNMQIDEEKKQSFASTDVYNIIEYMKYTKKSFSSMNILESYPLESFSKFPHTERDSLFGEDGKVPLVVQTRLSEYRKYVWHTYPTWLKEYERKELFHDILRIPQMIYQRLKGEEY